LSRLPVKSCDVVVTLAINDPSIRNLNFFGESDLEIRTHPDLSVGLNGELVIYWKCTNAEILWLNEELLDEAPLEEVRSNLEVALIDSTSGC